MTRTTGNEKKMWSGRLSGKTHKQIAALKKALKGLSEPSETAIVEHAIDELAKKHKVKVAE